MHLRKTETSLCHGILSTLSTSSRSNSLALEATEETSVVAREGTRASKGIHLACASKSSLAGADRSGSRDSEESALGTSLEGVLDVLERVSFGENLAVLLDLESMVEDVVKIVVDDVEEGVAGNLGSAAGNVVHVVALEGDQLKHVSKLSVTYSVPVTYVALAEEEDGPVVISIAACRPRAHAVNLVVRDRHATASSSTKDNMLATDQGCSTVINPDVVSAVKRDSVAAPDQAGVEVGDMDVLDDNILDAIGKTKTLSFDDTLGTDADDALV